MPNAFDKSRNQFNNKILKTANLMETNQDQNEEKAGFWTFFLFNPRLASLAMLTLIILGLTALLNIDIEANPEVNQPTGLVQTFYPNSSPSDVEEQITNKLEEEFANLAQLKEITSSSSSGFSSIFVTFESSADPEEVLQDLREAVSNVGGLPDDANNPQVIEFDFNNQSIVTLSVVGNLEKKELTEIADNITDEIKEVSGVSKIEVSGDSQELIKIELDPVRLDNYNISLGEVIQAINGNNLNAPLGEINKNQSKINLRLVGKAESINQLKQIPIRNISTDDSFNIITLGQLATIKIDEEKQNTASFVSSSLGEAQTAVTLNVFKRSGGNIVNIVSAIEERVAELNKELPSNVEVIKTNDNAYFIRNDIRTLSVSGLQTIGIIFLALLLFLSLAESLIASLAIPLIFLITFAVIYFTDQTLNGLTIFSLILSLGLVVDTSIVIVEGIHDGRREGLTPKKAAIKAIKTFRGPLIAGTLTTIAAFFPMLLVGGVVGDFIKTIPIVLSITLAASLFVSLAFSPLIASKLLSKKKKASGIKDAIIDKIRDIYESTLKNILHSRVKRILILFVTIILFAASMTLPILQVLKAQLFPVVDTPFVYVNIEAPIGTELAATRELAKPVESLLNDYEEIDNYILNVGRSIDTGFSPGNSGTSSNVASMIVNLTDISTGRQKSYDFTETLRKDFDNLDTPLTIKVEEISSGPPTSAPFEARIVGPDLDTLRSISDELKIELEDVSGLININSEFDNQPEEAVLTFDPERLSYYGLTNQQTTLTISALTSGIDSGTISIEGEEFDMKTYLFNNGQNEASLAQIQNLTINTPKGQIPISYIGKIETKPALESIPHLDRERSVRVRAFTEKDVLITELIPTIQAKIDTLELPNNYSIETGGEDEDIQESFADLFSSMFIAVILILIILVTIFNSFRQTIIVLASLPLAVIGIFPGLALLNLPLSFPAFLGIVMLTGIVVNDAIVLMDQININRKNIGNIKESIIRAAKSRLTPILLTSITTIFGLMPISLKDEFWRGLGFSVIFGLIAATFLTLYIIPILYSILFRQPKIDQNQ